MSSRYGRKKRRAHLILIAELRERLGECERFAILPSLIDQHRAKAESMAQRIIREAHRPTMDWHRLTAEGAACRLIQEQFRRAQ